MLTLIQLLLLSVITLPSMASPSFNLSTSVLDSGPCRQQTVLDPQIGHILQPCWCYNNGDGVAREELITAIQNFCNAATSTVWGLEGGLNVNGVIYLPYFPDPQRPIIVKQEWWAGVIGDDDLCRATFRISVDDCVNSMQTVIDGCDKGSADDKQGGFAYDACLLWTVDPNPSINNPQIYSSIMPSATGFVTTVLSADAVETGK